MSIKYKIGLAMLLILVIPLMITGFISYKNSEALEYAIIEKENFEKLSGRFEKIFNEYDQHLIELTEQAELQVDEFNYPQTGSNHSFENMPVANDDNKTAFFETFLMDYQKDHKFLLNVYVATPDDAFYVSNIPPAEVDLSDVKMTERDWYTAALQNKGNVVWTEPYKDTGTGNSTITLARTLTDTSGSVIGVVGFDFDMHALAQMLRNSTLQVTVITGVIALIIGGLFVFIFVNAIGKNLHLVRDQLNLISEGKLGNPDVVVNSKDEISELAHALNKMQSNLREIIGSLELASNQVATQSNNLTQTADEVNTGAAQIVTTMNELASGSETQAHSATDVSSTMHRFNEDVGAANDHAMHVSEISKNLMTVTGEGSQSMEASQAQMEHIESVVKEAVEKVEGLDEQTQEITTLISVIQDIADQTNLLALNAAIEAARAGEQGQGFAVVADEVRKLAEQVSGSVDNITKNIVNIQEVSDDVAQSLEGGYVAVRDGAEQIQITGQVFNGINDAINHMVTGIDEVFTSLADITKSSYKVSSEVESIAAVSEESAAGIEETYASVEQSSQSMRTIAAGAKELEHLSVELKETVNNFEL